jgi:pimeloyl-ACP methyl ester carboxylesterase
LTLSTGGTIPYYRSLPLVRNDSVQHVVIVVHGKQRDADRYYDRAVAAASADRALSDLVLLAPNFRTLEDRPAAREHYWSSHGWKIGNKSLDRNRISSFAVMNELLARVCSIEPAIFPNLQTIVIVGHSAGGQFVGRYVAGGTECLNQAVDVRYVVMNPSSYLYVDGRRRSKPTGAFGPVADGCLTYDDYKYGLRNLNAYMRRVGVKRLRSQLFKRRTYYLAGQDDTRMGGSLDSRCEANLQGQNRLARFANYRDYASLFEDWTGAEFITIPGVGHDGARMLGSEVARRIMFH